MVKNQKTKYNFFLSPHSHELYNWESCPKCNAPTAEDKFCLMIHYKNEATDFQRMISLNKSAAYCPDCDLLIVKKTEINPLLDEMLTKLNLHFKEDNYLIFGTIDEADWKRNQESPIPVSEIFGLVYLFKDIWEFNVAPPTVVWEN